MENMVNHKLVKGTKFLITVKPQFHIVIITPQIIISNILISYGWESKYFMVNNFKTLFTQNTVQVGCRQYSLRKSSSTGRYQTHFRRPKHFNHVAFQDQSHLTPSFHKELFFNQVLYTWNVCGS